MLVTVLETGEGRLKLKLLHKDHQNETVLDLARRLEHQACLQYLEDAVEEARRDGETDDQMVCSACVH